MLDTGAWWDLDSWVLSDTLAYTELSEALDDAARKDVLRPAPFSYVPVVPTVQALMASPLGAAASVPPTYTFGSRNRTRPRTSSSNSRLRAPRRCA